MQLKKNLKRVVEQAALSFSPKVPRISEWVLWMWAKVSILLRREPHSLFFKIANRLNYRVRTITRLGNGMKIKVVWNDLLGLEIFRTGFHDARNVRILKRLLSPGMVFFDVGAHVGQYTLLASQLVGPDGRVHSFEPDPETFSCLTDNIEMNRLTNVQANQLALFSEQGEKKFFVSWPEYMGGNSLWSEPGDWPGRVFNVKCDTVDSYVRQQAISKISLLKIDVEGGEVDLLLGANTALGLDDKPTILLEFNGPALVRSGHSCAELAKTLRRYGYQLFQITDRDLIRLGFLSANGLTFDCLAVPENKTAVILQLFSVSATAVG